jgi:hypothetical protein
MELSEITTMVSSARTLALKKRATKKLKMSTMMILQQRIRIFLQTLKQNLWKD